ncbi:hypothetical protein BGP_6225 [Beggiatoa sp. PS]|nr:hypothetical protein BGP_6225 [Beggiatoa sp. PS]
MDDFSEEVNKLHNHQEYLQGEVTLFNRGPSSLACLFRNAAFKNE